MRRRALAPFLWAATEDAAGLGASEVAWDAHGIVAVALWLPPGSFPWTWLRQARAAPALLRTGLAAPRAVAAFARLGAAAAAAAPQDAHWHLEALGVHRRGQRRGWGSRVLQPGLDRADAAGLACYLETSDPANAGFYGRLGFEVVAPHLDHLAGGPRYTGMRRPPRR
jgi:ribosomal protein S18 acetylase RimI-like enzyme